MTYDFSKINERLANIQNTNFSIASTERKVNAIRSDMNLKKEKSTIKDIILKGSIEGQAIINGAYNSLLNRKVNEYMREHPSANKKDVKKLINTKLMHENAILKRNRIDTNKYKAKIKKLEDKALKSK